MAQYDPEANDTRVVDYNSIVTTTEKAYLFKIGDVEVWLPKSEIEVDEEDQEIYLPKWLHDRHF